MYFCHKVVKFETTKDDEVLNHVHYNDHNDDEIDVHRDQDKKPTPIDENNLHDHENNSVEIEFIYFFFYRSENLLPVE